MARQLDTDPTNLSSKAGQGRDQDPVASAAPAVPPGRPPAPTAIGVRGWLRWVWRQLTSMRVALLLLLLLAVAAVPGSLFPQAPQDAAAVAEYHLEHPGLAPWLDRLGFFDVYASPWFAAVYLLLFTSLIGCILPRVAVHWRALRSAPPRVPRSFARFDVRAERPVAEAPAVVEGKVLAALRGRYRAVVTPDGITAERGYLRESGNLLFHLSLVGILVSLAAGQLYSFRGQAIVVEGESFANSVLAYDSFDPGTFFDTGSLDPFTLTLEDFSSTFTVDAQARDFNARVSVAEPDGTGRTEDIRVNRPLDVNGANVYLSGNGYAPRITVRDGAGELAFGGTVPFLPQDAVYTSKGVIKVPDVTGSQEQLGLTGMLLPTAVLDDSGAGVRSIHPDPGAPLMVLTLWAGDLGLDDGAPQNVYVLDTDGMRQVYEPAEDGSAGSAEGGQRPVTIFLAPGETVELPEGLGTVTFESLPRFAALDLRYDPSLTALLVSSVLAMVGLFGSLFLPRRRLWVRLSPGPDGGTWLSAAALARGDDPGLTADLERVLGAVGAGPSGAGQGDQVPARQGDQVPAVRADVAAGHNDDGAAPGAPGGADPRAEEGH